MRSANGLWIDKINNQRKLKKLILDIDSSESKAYRKQEGSACNVHSTNNWQKVMSPIIGRYKSLGIPMYLRGDAAFGSPDFYEYAESENIFYTARLKANNNLYKAINHLLTRPVGRPSYKPKVFYHSFKYQAQSWNKPRRVAAKIAWHCDQLFPKIGFIVTNLNWANKKCPLYPFSDS